MEKNIQFLLKKSKLFQFISKIKTSPHDGEQLLQNYNSGCVRGQHRRSRSMLDLPSLLILLINLK